MRWKGIVSSSQLVDLIGHVQGRQLVPGVVITCDSIRIGNNTFSVTISTHLGLTHVIVKNPDGSDKEVHEAIPSVDMVQVVQHFNLKEIPE